MKNKLLLCVVFLILSTISSQCAELEEVVTDPSSSSRMLKLVPGNINEPEFHDASDQPPVPSARQALTLDHNGHDETNVDDPVRYTSREHSSTSTETQTSVKLNKHTFIEILGGRACNILARPLMAAAAALALHADITIDSSLLVGAAILGATGGLMELAGDFLENRGRDHIAEYQKIRLNITKAQTAQEIDNLVDTYLAHHSNIRWWDKITSKVYGYTGGFLSLVGLPSAIVGGIMFISGQKSDDHSLSQFGEILGVTALAVYTLGSELQKTAKERKEELERIDNIKNERIQRQAAIRRRPAQQSA
jgi:hypothetical protein